MAQVRPTEPHTKDDDKQLSVMMATAVPEAAGQWGVKAAEIATAPDPCDPLSELAMQRDPALDNQGLRYPRWSCFVLDFHSRFRQSCIRLIEHSGFDAISMFVIFLNCITLALFDPYDEVHDLGRRNVPDTRCAGRTARRRSVK